MTLSVLLAGGGTTGHVAPLLALADCLRRREPQARVLVLGTAEGLEARLVPQAGYDLALVPRVPLPRQLGPDLARLPGRLTGAVRAASDALSRVGAQVVVGFGGYVSTPAYLAARRAGVPIVVHEANARPGLANRLGARLTSRVAVTFPGTPLPHARLTGLPMRTGLTGLDRAALRERARAELGLAPAGVVLLVTGGSLGAQRLNATFGAAAPVLTGAGVQVLHLTGRGKVVSAGAGPDQGYHQLEYCDRMDLAYAAADLVVCRAGAGTVSEVAALGLPAVFVPLPVGNGEQRLNAQPLADAGGGLIVPDSSCTPGWVREQLLPLLSDPGALIRMGRRASDFGITDGDERLADLVQQAAGGPRAQARP